jgi:hypothetical protein
MKLSDYTISIAMHNNNTVIVRPVTQVVGTIDVEMQQPDLAVQDHGP